MVKKWGKLTAFLLGTCMLASGVHGGVMAAPTEGEVGKTGTETPVEKYGTVQIAKDAETGYNQLCDANGNPIQLKGMSTFGLQWEDGSWVLNEAAFDALAYDWKCDIVRLAMYVTEDGYKEDPAGLLEKVEKGIQLATERGMYVIVDWHILSPGDPTNEDYLNAGTDLETFADIKAKHPNWNGPQLFFAYLSEKYGAQGNILFEIANEPNGLGTEENAAQVWEETLLPYHKGVVEAIREYDVDEIDNIIILGTDNWSQFVDAPAASVSTNNVEQDVVDAGGIPQIMYTIHFYAGTHDTEPDAEGKYWLGQKVLNALNAGQAVFCTEWGTSEATGDGGPYINYSERWLDFFEQNKISWCSWSLAKKNEISAAMLATTSEAPQDNNGDGIPEWPSEELSISGKYVRAKIRGEEAPMYGATEIVVDMEEGSPQATMLSDSPISAADYPLNVEDVKGNHMLSLSAVTGDVWSGPRISFQDLGTSYSIYKDLIFDVYLKENTTLVDGKLEIQPIIQTEALGWWGQQEQVTLTEDDFTTDETTGLQKASVKLTMKDIPSGDKLGHLTFLIGATEGFYMDNVGFQTYYNGDISEAPAVPDNPGTFIELPFDFEDGQREGWKKDGTSIVDYTQISIDEVAEADHALSFSITLEVGKNEWEDGARLSSPQGAYGTYDDCKDYDALAFDIYLEKDKATTGKIAIEVCSIPNGDGFWYQSGKAEIDPLKGEEVTTPDGRKLLKYSAYVALNATEYGKYPFTEGVEIRNTILALHGEDCDYSGRVYYDNIRYVDEEVQDAITKINAIGEVAFTDVSKKAIDAARKAYDALNEAQKAEISDEILQKLIAAEKTYKAVYEANEAVIASVVDKIKAIGTVTADDACKAKIDEARKAYNALTQAQKDKVDASVLKTLTDAEQAYEKAVADKKAEGDTKDDVEYIAKFSAKSTKIQKGKSSAVLASALTITEGDKVKEWSTSKKSVVSVNKKTGKIQAKKVGTAVITVTTEKGVTASIEVKVVKKAVKTTKLVVKNNATDEKLKNKSTVTLKKKEKLQLKTILTPITSPEKVTYKSSNKKIVTVSSKGEITAKKKGKATITVKSGKKSVKIKIKVK